MSSSVGILPLNWKDRGCIEQQVTIGSSDRSKYYVVREKYYIYSVVSSMLHVI